MQLPTCPSCGQSVLDDDVADCPFCGGAMDGSRAGSARQKPSAAAAAPAETPREPPRKSASASAVGRGRAQIVVDEDDPFGMAESGSSGAVQAAPRPSRGRLQKVICPMCEKPGFIPRTALGKSVRCANPKCMVPVFTATTEDSNDSGRTVRLADQEEAARRAELSITPRRRSPVMVYAVIGIAVLAIGGFAAFQFGGKSDAPKELNGVDLSRFSAFAEEEDQAQREQQERQKQQENAARNRKDHLAEKQINQLIALARQSPRDKALARRYAADLWLRLGRSQEAATELSQLVKVNRRSSFYSIIPYVSEYWRAQERGNSTAAETALAAAMSELKQSSFPASGRAAAEAVLTIATAMVAEGQQAEALQLISSRQQDQSILSERDSMITQAWLFLADMSLDRQLTPPSVLHSLQWHAPLHTAVAGGLAGHACWQQAAEWAAAAGDPQQQADCFLVIAGFAAQLRPPAEVTQLLLSQADAIPVPALSIRARAAIAAAARKSDSAAACQQQLAQLQVPETPAVPGIGELLRTGSTTNRDSMLVAMAAAETTVALLTLDQQEAAATTLDILLRSAAAVAPSTSELRLLANQAKLKAAAVRQAVRTEMRESDERKLDSLVRKYDSRLEALSAAAEDRRAQLVFLLSRITAAGGTEILQAAAADSKYLQTELQLDIGSVMIRHAALLSGRQLPAGELFPQSGSTLQILHGNDSIPLFVLGQVAAGSMTALNSAPEQSLQIIAGNTGDPLPGVRLCMTLELGGHLGRNISDPALVMAAVGRVPQADYREPLLIQAGWQLGRKGAADQIPADNERNAMEKISLLYGVAAAVCEQAAAEAAAGKEETASEAGKA